jgi:4-diphosphocytidyl-2-C-methyl-D-erythritol kinase
LLDFGDLLHFELRNDSEIHVNAGDLAVPLRDNLIYRAAKLLQQTTSCPLGACISLEKKLPIGGGIGGGSSDAASTLLGLNHLWNCGLPIDALARLGRELGADVPVFVRGDTAWAEGVGEELTPLATEPRHYLVLTPGCQVSTAALFSDPRLTRDSAPITLPLPRGGPLEKDWLERFSSNDFQPLVESLYPQVRAAREWLQQFSRAHLTGTGACVFAAFESRVAAEEILARLPDEWQGFVAAGVQKSPAHEQLAKFAAKQ